MVKDRCILFALILTCISTQALANGMEFPSNGTEALGRGGAFTAKADDLSAVELNPAGLAKLAGWHVYLGNQFSVYNATFSPLVFQEEDDLFTNGTVLPAEERFLGAGIKNDRGWQLVGPLVGISTDFGLRDWAFALSVYGPSANAQSSFDSDGRQRFMLVGTDVLLALYTASVAYRPLDNLSFGISLHWLNLIQAKLSMAVNGYWDQMNDWSGTDYNEVQGYEVRADVDVADDFAWAMTLGAWYRPIDCLELGLAFRLPSVNFNAEGETSLDFYGSTMAALYQSGQDSGGTQGLVAYDKNGNPTSKLPTTMTFSYPMVGRFGVRYVQWKNGVPEKKGVAREGDEELFDVEFDVVWEGWSALTEYNLQLDGYIKLAGAQNAQKIQFQPVVIPRQYKDTWSFRLGGHYHPLSFLDFQGGVYYETGAVPSRYTNIDFAGFDRIGVGLGTTFTYDRYSLSVAYSHIFQSTVEVSLAETGVYKQFPLQKTPPQDVSAESEPLKVGAGRFETSYDIVSVALKAHF